MELSERARELLRKTAMNYESHAVTLEKEAGVTLDYAQRFITHQLAFLFVEAKMKLENDEVFLRGANERIRQQRETIDQQQAEIKRLRAALQEVIDLSYTAFPVPSMREIAIRGLEQQQSEAPQEPLTPAELGEMAGKAESLRTQILRILSRSEKGVMFPAIAEKVPSSQTGVSRELGYLMHDGLADRLDAFRYNITAAGRDYLASLDKPTIETTEDYLSQLD